MNKTSDATTSTLEHQNDYPIHEHWTHGYGTISIDFIKQAKEKKRRKKKSEIKRKLSLICGKNVHLLHSNYP